MSKTRKHRTQKRSLPIQEILAEATTPTEGNVAGHGLLNEIPSKEDISSTSSETTTPEKKSPLEERVAEITRHVHALYDEMTSKKTVEKIEKLYKELNSQKTTLNPVLNECLAMSYHAKETSDNAEVESEKATQISKRDQQVQKAQEALETAVEKAENFTGIVTANNQFLVMLVQKFKKLQKEIESMERKIKKMKKQGQLSSSALTILEKALQTLAKSKQTILSLSQGKICDIFIMIDSVNHAIESLETNYKACLFLQMESSVQTMFMEEKDEYEELEILSSYHQILRSPGNQERKAENLGALNAVYLAARVEERRLEQELQERHAEIKQLHTCYGFFKSEIKTDSLRNLRDQHLRSAQDDLKGLDLLYKSVRESAAQTQKNLAMALHRIENRVEGNTSVRTHLSQLNEMNTSLSNEIKYVRTKMIGELCNTLNLQIKAQVLRKIGDEIQRIEDSKKKYEKTDNDIDGTLADAKKKFLAELITEIGRLETDYSSKNINIEDIDIYAEIAKRVNTAKQTMGQAKEKRTHHKSAIVRSSLFNFLRSKKSSTENFVDDLEKDMLEASAKRKTK